MPSPFPGMDPFIEDREWQDFHMGFNAVTSEILGSILEPRYFVRMMRREYVEHFLANEDGAYRLLPVPQERRETYLVIRVLPASVQFL